MDNLELNFKLLDFDINKHEFDTKDYVLNEDLRSAVKVAIALKQPLLITGEPGTGKTQLAYKIAKDLSKNNMDFLPEPFVFNTKTNSTATDLFYTYDAIKHFHDANIRDAGKDLLKPTSEYITLQALGEAIASTKDSEIKSAEYIKTKLNTSKSSVVLIDEIDKAPRDFPNDILIEIEKYQFAIKETNKTIAIDSKHRIIIILTSNSEKNLPDAFLRRCVFFHIQFKELNLVKIIKAHLGDESEYSNEAFINYFIEIRDKINKKKPSTAELIAWLKILEMNKFIEPGEIPDFNKLREEQKDTLKTSFSILAKTIEDYLSLNDNHS